MRLAKAQLKYHGLCWPPRYAHTFGGDLTDSGAYWVQSFAWLHNVGLCVWPDMIQLGVQLLYVTVANESPAAWKRLVAKADAFVLANFSDWRVLKGRCKRKGLSGILLRFDGKKGSKGARALPRVRRSSKYDLASAVRFCRVLFHTALAEHHPVAAMAFLRVMEFSRLIKNPSGLYTSELGDMRSTVSEMLPLVATAAYVTPEDCLKDLNASHNWHKSVHAAGLVEWLGGLPADEHGEWMQKVPSTALPNRAHAQQCLARRARRARHARRARPPRASVDTCCVCAALDSNSCSISPTDTTPTSGRSGTFSAR